MKLVKLSDLFTIHNGLASNSVEINQDRIDGMVRYNCPSKTYEGTLAGWVKEEDVNKKYIFPKDTLFVSTNGAGSHSYSYVMLEPFIPSNNGAALVPIKPMTLEERLYYAFCITKNRPLFSYGRIPNGNRLASILLPSEAPQWVKDAKAPDLSDVSAFALPSSINLPPVEEWGEFRYGDIFNIERGFYNKRPDDTNSGIPFVGSSENNNGVTSYIAADEINLDFIRKNRITISNNGSVGKAFYHKYSFTCSINVSILALKDRELNPSLAMFINSIIHLEKFRYSYGRVWNLARMSEARIKLPVTVGGAPDWDLMERYIKSLPFSKGLE